MTDLVRTQVHLSKKQRDVLIEIARKDGKSFSELVRDLLNAELRQRLYNDMRLAAEQLRDSYAANSELVDMNSLDSEDFINVGMAIY
jgi:Arc/MetJ-type ribon-helix-helix transcriptional regulator